SICHVLIPRAVISILFSYTTLFRSGSSYGCAFNIAFINFFSRVAGKMVSILSSGTDSNSPILPIWGLVFSPGGNLSMPSFDYERYEVHTSELQSRIDLVCHLMIEKQ